MPAATASSAACICCTRLGAGVASVGAGTVGASVGATGAAVGLMVCEGKTVIC